MAELKVTPSFLREKAGNFRNNDSNFKNLMDNIRKEMSTMKGTYWEGQAADSFIQRFDQMAQRFPAYSNAMQEYAKYLDTAATDYAATETQVKTGAEGLKVNV